MAGIQARLLRLCQRLFAAVGVPLG